MSQYTTGELAKLAGVSVRTVQYYDKREILSPSSLTESGRRIYDDNDLECLKIICFLRSIDLSLNQIKNILAENSSDKIIILLLEQHINELKEVLNQKKEQVDTSVNLLNSLKKTPETSLESLIDISLIMKNKNMWNRFRNKMLLFIILSIVVYILIMYISSIYHIYWLMFLALVLFLAVMCYSIIRYYNNVLYICPNCHYHFKPSFKNFCLGSHTAKTRRLTCPNCHVKSHCLEIFKENDS